MEKKAEKAATDAAQAVLDTEKKIDRRKRRAKAEVQADKPAAEAVAEAVAAPVEAVKAKRTRKQAAAPKLVIQSPFGGEITPEEIRARLGEADAVYIRVDQNMAYWVRGEESGDIDLWVIGPRKTILETFTQQFHVHSILYREFKADIFDDTIVEVHFLPTQLYNPFCNARFQRWMKRHSPISDKAYLTYPDAEFNAVFCMAHMYRHYLAGGLGLRQMMDYYYILKNLPAAARRPVFQTLKRLGMGSFTAASMMAVQFNFGLEDEYLLCKPDTKRGRKLITEMIQMGNFGTWDPRHRHAEDETLFARFLRRNRRTFSYLRLYPRQVFWAPLYRFIQFIWRIFRGYQ